MSKYLDYYYAAYGSNLNLEQMEKRCANAIYLGNVIVNDCVLTFRSNSRCGVMNIESGVGSVELGLFKITKKDEDELDIYEGYPHLYVKKFRTVNFNGERRKIMFYTMKNKLPLSLPSLSYYNTVIRGYVDCTVDMTQLFDAYDYSINARREWLHASNL